MPAGSVHGEDSLPGLCNRHLLNRTSHVGETESELSVLSLCTRTHPTGSLIISNKPSLVISFYLNFFFTPNTVTQGVEASTYGFLGDIIHAFLFTYITLTLYLWLDI